MPLRMLLFLFVAAGTCASTALACIMIPATYKGDVDQAGQEVVIMFHDGHQEMVIRVEPYFQDNINENGEPVSPEHIDWVVTVPNKPTGYRLADRAIFKEASDLATRLQRLAVDQYEEWERQNGASSNSAMGSEAGSWDSLEIESAVGVGPYTITAVKGVGSNAVSELNKYLKGRGYPEEDPGHLKWFIDNQFTFLCIHIKPPVGNTNLGERLDLEPLQIGFESDKPYYPGKFSSRQGNFQLRLRVLSTQPLSLESLGINQRKLSCDYMVHDNVWTARPLPETILGVLSEADLDWQPERWFVNALDSEGFNQGENGIANWKEDVFFALGDASDMPPEWYVGDGDGERPYRFSYW